MCMYGVLRMLYFTLVPNYVKPEEEIKVIGPTPLLTLTVRHFFSPSFMFIGRGGGGGGYDSK